MPLYMYQAAYTAESWAAQMKNPQNRVETVGRQVTEAVGGKMIDGWYCLGDYDVILIADVPNIESMAAIAVAIAAGGAIKSSQTTVLMTGAQLFYQFQLDDAVPEDHLVRKIDTALDLSWLRSELAPHYSSMGRPSIDPELMIRMLVVGYVFAIRSERLICREVQVNLAYRWFCKLGIEDAIPDHSAFSRARNERFRDGDVFRRVFERV